jgi:hypothetical protein
MWCRCRGVGLDMGRTCNLEINTGVHCFTASDAWEVVVGKGDINMKTSSGRVIFIKIRQARTRN